MQRRGTAQDSVVFFLIVGGVKMSLSVNARLICLEPIKHDKRIHPEFSGRRSRGSITQ